ncbi:MAG: D-alanyl-D-alanine carboxypeptidase [Burkholderiales bacterium]|nr:D-alanyl-D-alanine carboxypeptidase [Burkholderiales bacterium]MDE2286846.1 D-alanyl-D-alanine carboxypeptidase [Burkholderiales bacterium]
MSFPRITAACSAGLLILATPAFAAAATPTTKAAPAAPAAASAAAAVPTTPLQAALLQAVPPPQLDARSWLVTDLTSGQTLAESNAHEQIAPASLTKLMTAYITFKALKDGTIKRDQMVSEPLEAYHTGGSRMFVDPKVPVSIDDLLMGMIVQSGNDAAMTLAYAVGGSTSTFVGMMNQQAQQWHLKGTHFVDPTGLPDPNHHTTAYDLSVIAAHIIDDFPDDYARYFKVKKFTYNKITQPNRVSLLFTDPTVDGMKTGYTQEAGYCMITSAQRNTPSGPRRILSVVIGTPSEHARVADSQALLTWAYQNSEDVVLAQANKPMANVRVWKGTASTVGLGESRPIVITVPRGSAKNLQTKVVPPKALVAPIQAGQTIGALQVDVSGKQIGSYPLHALAAVPQAGFVGRTWDSLRMMFAK